jgi:hypothetical protein
MTTTTSEREARIAWGQAYAHKLLKRGQESGCMEENFSRGIKLETTIRKKIEEQSAGPDYPARAPDNPPPLEIFLKNCCRL